MVTIRVPFFRRADFLIPFAIATALIISVGVASAVDLERGLVAYYSFDDCTAKDLSGNGNDGIIYGAKCVDGKFGKALRFDGVNDYVEVADSASLDLTKPFTIECWFKWNTVQNTWTSLVRKTIDPWGYPYGMYHIGIYKMNKIMTQVTVGGEQKQLISDFQPEVGQWYHVVFVYPGAVYVNGNKIIDFPNYGDCDTNDQPLIIGASRWDREFFDGIIDEVRIYNRALSEEEIRALYEQGVAPRPKLAIEMDIDTSLKQGEVRKGTIRVENVGNSDAKSVEVRLFSEGLGIDVEKSYAKIPSGEAREFLFEVSANEAGTFKLSAYAEYWDDKGNKYVETAEKSVHVEAVVLPTSQAQETPEARETARPAGFYAIFTSLLMAVSYFLIRLKGKKN